MWPQYGEWPWSKNEPEQEKKIGHRRIRRPEPEPEGPEPLTTTSPPLAPEDVMEPFTFPLTPSYRVGSYGGTSELEEITTYWNTNYSLPHSPDNPVGKVVSPWDGITYLNNFSNRSINEIQAWLYPNGNNNHLRGLKELYDSLQPFSDVNNPTPSEIDYWIYRVFCHVRRLCGVTDYLEASQCRMLQAQWNLEWVMVTYGNPANWGGGWVGNEPNVEKTCLEQEPYWPTDPENPLPPPPECCPIDGTWFRTETTSGTAHNQSNWYWIASRIIRKMTIPAAPEGVMFQRFLNTSTIGWANVRMNQYPSGSNLWVYSVVTID